MRAIEDEAGLYTSDNEVNTRPRLTPLGLQPALVRPSTAIVSPHAPSVLSPSA